MLLFVKFSLHKGNKASHAVGNVSRLGSKSRRVTHRLSIEDSRDDNDRVRERGMFRLANMFACMLMMIIISHTCG